MLASKWSMHGRESRSIDRSCAKHLWKSKHGSWCRIFITFNTASRFVSSSHLPAISAYAVAPCSPDTLAESSPVPPSPRSWLARPPASSLSTYRASLVPSGRIKEVGTKAQDSPKPGNHYLTCIYDDLVGAQVAGIEEAFMTHFTDRPRRDIGHKPCRSDRPHLRKPAG